MKKKAKAQDTAGSKSRSISIRTTGEESKDRVIAKLTANGVVGNAMLVVDYSKESFGELSLDDTIDVLRKKIDSVRDGNRKNAETLLTAQAVALNALFVDLARRAALNMGERLDATERYLRLALKAQGQCRTTLETLSNIQNPPVMFARQANIANGPQQVNNCAPRDIPGGMPSRTRAENLKSVKNELLEHQDGEWLDAGTATGACGGDQALAAVGKIDGAKKR